MRIRQSLSFISITVVYALNEICGPEEKVMVYGKLDFAIDSLRNARVSLERCVSLFLVNVGVRQQ